MGKSKDSGFVFINGYDPKSRRRVRPVKTCQRCFKLRIKCDRQQDESESPQCSACKARGVECVFGKVRDQTAQIIRAHGGSPIEATTGNGTASSPSIASTNSPQISSLLNPITAETTNTAYPELSTGDKTNVLHIEIDGRGKYLLSPSQEDSRSNALTNQVGVMFDMHTERARRLIQLYFNQIHSSMPMIDKEAFFRSYSTADKGITFQQLACAICAVASRLGDNANEWSSRGRNYYDLAKNLMEEYDYKPDIWCVQAHLVLERYVECVPRKGVSGRVYVEFAMIIRLAVLAGLHRSSSAYQHRTWQLCYVSDSCIALSAGLDASIRFEHVDIPRAGDVKDPLELHNHIQFIYYVKIIQLITRVYELVRDLTCANFESIAENLASDLRQFRADLPDTMQLPHPDAVTRETRLVIQSATVAHVVMILDAAEMILFRCWYIRHKKPDFALIRLRAARHCTLVARDFIAAHGVTAFYASPRAFNLANHCLLNAMTAFLDESMDSIPIEISRLMLYDCLTAMKQITPYSRSPWLMRHLIDLEASLGDANDPNFTDPAKIVIDWLGTDEMWASLVGPLINPVPAPQIGLT